MILRLLLIVLVFGNLMRSDQAHTKDFSLKLIDPISESLAGEPIQLKFKSKENQKTLSMIVSNSWGSSVLSSVTDGDFLVFEVPSTFFQRRGILIWQIIETDLNGFIEINATNEGQQIESYLGPTRIHPETGEKAMFVNTQLDGYDNPLSNQELDYRYRLKNIQLHEEDGTFELASYDYLPQSQTKLIATASTNKNDLYSKEFLVNYTAGYPTDFEVEIDTPGSGFFADGNDLLEINTSAIKDQFGNLVEDGTIVNFTVKTQDAGIFNVQSSTIRGVATGRFSFPYESQSWKVSASVGGLAFAKAKTITFQPALQKIMHQLDRENNKLLVGPLTSYMKQLYPDGLEVSITFIGKEKNSTISKSLKNGYVSFDLNEKYLKNNSKITVLAAGIEKEIDLNGE